MNVYPLFTLFQIVNHWNEQICPELPTRNYKISLISAHILNGSFKVINELADADVDILISSIVEKSH